MRGQIALGLAAALLCLFLGWMLPPKVEAPVSAPPPRFPVPVVERPSSDFHGAAAYFAELNPPPPPPAPPVKAAPPAPPPPPPPPDVSVVFRNSLTAVVQTPGGWAVVLTDGPSSRGRRLLSEGGMFMNGWRVVHIDNRSVSLQRGRVIKAVPLYSTSPTA